MVMIWYDFDRIAILQGCYMILHGMVMMWYDYGMILMCVYGMIMM